MNPEYKPAIMIPAFSDDSSVLILCPLCGEFHRHSKAPGYRYPHCSDLTDSFLPRKQEQYFIQQVHTSLPAEAIRLDAKITRLRRQLYRRYFSGGLDNSRYRYLPSEILLQQLENLIIQVNAFNSYILKNQTPDDSYFWIRLKIRNNRDNQIIAAKSNPAAVIHPLPTFFPEEETMIRISPNITPNTADIIIRNFKPESLSRLTPEEAIILVARRNGVNVKLNGEDIELYPTKKESFAEQQESAARCAYYLKHGRVSA